jgi:glycosyltransferase involved in cell wall biosynthesis
LFRLPILRGFRHAASYLHQGRAVASFIDRRHSEDPFDLVEYSEGGDYWHRQHRPFKVVTHLHGSRYTFLKHSGRLVTAADWRQRKLELAFIRGADWVFSPSRALAGIVQEEAGVTLPSLTILPYPLDAVSAAVAPRKGADAGALRVIFAARNDPVKGGDVLLDAAREIEGSGGGVIFDFFGFVPRRDQSVPDSVRIHGFVPRTELLKSYGRADVAVVPSFWDNSPNTVYEAMASGLPVVGSSVGGIPELIGDGESGFLVAPRDSAGIAGCLQQLRDDTELRVRMGAAARKRIVSIADPKPNLESRLGVYRDVVSGHRS